MFSSKISRVAHRVAPTAPTTASAPTSHRAAPRLASTAARCPHHRRHSSSKASCPPDSSSSKAAPAAKTAAATATSEAPSQHSLRSTKRPSKYRRHGQEKPAKPRVDDASQFAALPTVPNIQHLQPRDFGFSSFFSLHRPLSLTTPIPQPVSEDAFRSIFESSQQPDAWLHGNSAERRPEDVIYTLSQTIETIESEAAAAPNDVVHIDVLQQSPSNSEGATHLDGAPRHRLPSLEEIVAQAKPFQAPPPPQPFVTESKQDRKRAARQAKRSSPRLKSYTTTIVVTESMSPDGQKTYAASASPIVQLPDPTSEDATAQGARYPNRPWTPFRKRRRTAFAIRNHPRFIQERGPMREPNSERHPSHLPDERKPSMSLISVKRQRKLKMKKHKYKKLMKRTRNLRRKLDSQ